MKRVHPPEILLVEDSPTDRLLAQRALESMKLVSHVTCVSDGVEALAFLRREGAYALAVRPDLVLLDLNLPRKSGLEVLAEMKADPDLRSIPVVVLTTSTADRDVIEAYALHANCLISKSVDFEHFVALVHKVSDFWFSVVTLPPKG
jgi:two-component system response regulator